jgi:capsular polysaccharide biosynthesis protein
MNTVTPDHHPPASRVRIWPTLRRRWWVALVTTAAAVAAALLIANVRDSSHTASATAVVPSGSKGPGSANDAEQLAATYAAMIPEDQRILRALAHDIRLTQKQVESRVTVVNTSDTALLQLRFTDSSADGAVKGARALARAVSHGASRNIRPATIGIVRVPDKPLGSAGGGTTGIAIGAILGLFLGGVIMVFLERADARADRFRELEDVIGLPVTELGKRSVGPQVALVERWRSLGARDPARIALVPASRRAEDAAMAAAEALAAAARERGQDVRVERVVGAASARRHELVGPGGEQLVDEEASAAAVRLVPSAGPGREPSGESVGLASDVVVLVQRAGAPLRQASARLDTLRGLGIQVERGLLVPRRLRAPRRPRALRVDETAAA